MSLEDRTNEEIPLAMPGQGTLSVDVDSDSHIWPEPWVWMMFDGGNEHWARLTLEEAGKLHDRLGLILGRDSVTDRHVESVARRLHPYLWSGVFEENLAILSIFNAEQAAESAERKRREKCDYVRRVLEASAEERQ